MRTNLPRSRILRLVGEVEGSRGKKGEVIEIVEEVGLEGEVRIPGREARSSCRDLGG